MHTQVLANSTIRVGATRTVFPGRDSAREEGKQSGEDHQDSISSSHSQLPPAKRPRLEDSESGDVGMGLSAAESDVIVLEDTPSPVPKPTPESATGTSGEEELNTPACEPLMYLTKVRGISSHFNRPGLAIGIKGTYIYNYNYSSFLSNFNNFFFSILDILSNAMGELLASAQVGGYVSSLHCFFST